ncbi:MAG TPA: hypothetical protein VIS76_05105, partial [Pseudomonadales bacterium]
MAGALIAALAAIPALALIDRGVVYIDMASGISEARWEIADVVQQTQALHQVNPCALDQTTEALLSFSAAEGVASAKQDAMGVDFVNGRGTNCAGIDARGSTQEALTVTLGDTFTTGGVVGKNLRFIKLVLQLELKGTESVTEIAVNDAFSGAAEEIWEVRGGASISASEPGRDPADIASENRVIDCFAGGSDVAPDARDTCVVSIAAFGNSFTITTINGSTSLEGGRSVAGATEIHLTDASGLYDCGEVLTTTSLDEAGVQIAGASCRRLETNLTDCPADQCVAVPADLRFENAGFDLVLEFDEDDQCVAVQCQIAFAPYDLTTALPGNSRTESAIIVSRDGNDDIDDVYPLAGIETTYLQPPIVQFLSTDDEYYVQHCLEELVRHPTVDVTVLSAASATSPPFVAGQTISNGTETARVVSYRSVDGRNSLVYYVTSAGNFAAGDTLTGPTGSASVLTDWTPSTFIEELVGDTANLDGAGYALLDYSPGPDGKANDLGIQHACLRSIDYELPGFTDDG